MERERVLATGELFVGLVLLYVGWANVGGLVPPFRLCAELGDTGVHVGENLALVYDGGCAPYEGAHGVFLLLTATAVGAIGLGVRTGKWLRNGGRPKGRWRR